MSRIALLLITAALAAGTATGAEDPWVKVQALKSRAELRIYKKGAREPLMATLDEADGERIVIVVKNQQLAIPKEDIDRLDARMVVKEPRKFVKETTSKVTEPDYTPHPPAGPAVPGESTSTSFSHSSTSKPDFETVYRRPVAPPKN